MATMAMVAEEPPRSQQPGPAIAVAPGGTGAIARALRTAAPYSSILLQRGVYTESGTLDVNVEGIVIMLDPEAPPASRTGSDDCVISSEGRERASGPLFNIGAAQCTLSHLTIEVGTEEEAAAAAENPKSVREPVVAAIRVAGNSEAFIADCHVSCKNGCGIEAADTARPIIRSCHIEKCVDGILLGGSTAATVGHSRVRKCRSSCVKSRDFAAGVVHDNAMEKGGDSCIVATGRSSTHFLRNALGNTKGCGVMLSESTTALVEGNEVSGKHINGLQAGGSANPMVKNNKILGSSGSGVVLHDWSKGTYANNHVIGSRLAGVGIRDHADPIFTGNLVSEGEGSGLVLLGDATGVIENNRFVSNTCAGIGIKGNACALFDRNVVTNNQGYGVWLQDTSRGTFQNNSVEGNGKAGFAVSHQAAPRLHSNRITGGKQVGLLVQNQAGGHYEANIISNNKAVNVMLLGHSNATLLRNVINDSAGGGVLIRGDSTCTLRFNTMEGNYRANAAVLDNSKPTLEENVIQNGMGRGLVITGNAAGQYIGNTIRSHSLAGVYVGGNAEPHMVRNIVCESGASGIVVEDCARGCFADNSMSGNASAAVAVQGNAAPVMERNIVLHYGKGGIWLGEKAGGVFTGNLVEDSSAGWRIGMEVTATVESPISLRSLSQYEQDLRDRIDKAMQYCRPMPRFQSAVFVKNPGTGDTPTIGTVVASYPETLVRTCESRDARGRPLNQDAETQRLESGRTRSSHF
eukprot:Tamp_07699.p1 GENE.Tamp_07699~~Tamp_07699.p1  ORF type:complete len:747 (+),score=180.26 Tamp_07699:74-2314(+)